MEFIIHFCPAFKSPEKATVLLLNSGALLFVVIKRMGLGATRGTFSRGALSSVVGFPSSKFLR